MKGVFLLLVCLGGWGVALAQINEDILQKIDARSAATHTDGLLVIYGPDTLLHKYYGSTDEPTYIASAGKSLTALAIGRLLEMKLLDSLDQPVYSLYPEWKQGMKQQVTIRMLLNHTSGLQNVPNASVELEPAPDYRAEDIIKMALAAELDTTPGAAFSYNNKAVALLGGIVEQASGKPFDVFFAEQFFEPMGITEYDWIRDKAGNATTHGAFILRTSDFAKFGRLMLDGGVWQGQRLVPEHFVAQAVQQGQPYYAFTGLLWWRVETGTRVEITPALHDAWAEAGASEAFLKATAPLVGHRFYNTSAWFEAMGQALGNANAELNENVRAFGLPTFKRSTDGELLAYYADGFRGNYLVVLPEHDLIAVRIAKNDESYDWGTDGYGDFVDLVCRLVK